MTTKQTNLHAAN